MNCTNPYDERQHAWARLSEWHFVCEYCDAVRVDQEKIATEDERLRLINETRAKGLQL